MSKLRAPLKDLLDEPLPEVQVQRIWRRLQAPAAARPRRRWLPLSAAACVLIAGAWFLLRPAAPLAVNDLGALAPAQMLGGEYPTHWPLTDGSRIELGAATRLEVVQNSGEDFAVELKAGHAGFDVQPGGPRRWSIRAGGLRVEVVGTSFIVERNARGVAVQVRHGVVQVRGPGVNNGLQRLVAGERVFVQAKPEPGTPPTAAASDDERSLPPTAAAPVDDRSPPPLAAATQPATDSAAVTQPANASATDSAAATRARTATPSAAVTPPAATRTRPTAQEVIPRNAERQPAESTSRSSRDRSRTSDQSAATPAALLREADQARQIHDYERAYALLERVQTQARGSVHAALASWTMGRMRLSSDPSHAAGDIAQALQGKLPDGLREGARARLVEAHARAGNPAAARAAANAYRAAHPKGHYLNEVERWTREP